MRPSQLFRWLKSYVSLLLYTLLFVAVAIFANGIFADAGRNWLWDNDGVYQHFNSFLYANEYIRAIAKSIFRGESLSIPLMNYTLGQGADIITTLNSYDFLDPVSWIMIVIFRHNVLRAYEAMIFAKLFLAGISFCVYCYVIGIKGNAKIATGALIYTFFGFGIYCCARHPNFMSGMYFLPLTFAAIEMYLKDRKKLPIILSTFFSILTSYYSFYMDAVAIAVYILIRLFPNRWGELKGNLKMLVKLIAVFLTGILLSSFTLLPTIHAFLNNARAGLITGYTDSLLYYPADYYRKMFEFFISSSSGSGYWNFLNFAPVVFLSICILFAAEKREWNRLRIIFLTFLGFLCIPFFGLMMNGFGYVSNRWNYIFALIVAVVYVVTFDHLKNLSAKETKTILVLCILWLSLCLHDEGYSTRKYLPFLLLFITLIAVFIVNQKYCSSKLGNAVLIALGLTSACVNINLLYSPNYGNYVREFRETQEEYDFFDKYSIAQMKGTADSDEFYRIETQESQVNLTGYNHARGTNFWWSIMSKDSHKFYTDLQLNTLTQNCNFKGLDGRTALLSLASVKYYTAPKGSEDAIPFGFRKVDEQVYENEYFLPAAFLYDGYIDQSTYESLNPLEKQQAMLQGAVIDNEEIELSLKSIVPENRMEEIPFSVLETDGIEVTQNEIVVKEANGTLTLAFDAPKNGELYLWFQNLQLDPKKANIDITVTSGLRESDNKEQLISKFCRAQSPRYTWYVKSDGITANLGYVDERGRNYCTLRFANTGSLSFDQIRLFTNPMSKYEEDIEKLRSSACNDIYVSDDHIYGTVQAEDKRLLQFTIPYSDGWRAYVDGEETDIIKSNVMYMALEIEEGSHTIELKYGTPYLKIGTALSLLTLAGIVCVAVKELRCRKTKKHPKNT